MITKEYLQKVFLYKNGFLLWKEQRGPVKPGSVAGTMNSRGYIHIRLDMNFHQAHRLIWIYFNGEIPEEMSVDHINRDRADNRIENLRLLTTSENNRNSKRSDHTSVGVWKVGGKYSAYYNTNGKRYYIGRFNTESEAIIARKEFILNMPVA